jgi:hypothetical protein
MTLALFSDANAWLDITKIRFENANDAEPERVQAESVVLGAVKDLFPDNYALWEDDPTPPQEPVPRLIRTIVSLLMASYRYAKRYSEESLEENSFALSLEKRAMYLLEGLRAGSITLDDVDYESSLSFGEADFWPNDSTVVWDDNLEAYGLHVMDPLRYASMDKRF